MQVGIDEGQYEILDRIEDEDGDFGPCEGIVCSNGSDPDVIVWTYKDDPKRISFHIDQ